MITPGLEPKSMSDEELMRKISELNSKMNISFTLGYNGLIDQLQQMMDSLQFEQRERINIKMHEMMERNTKSVVDTDPEFNITINKDPKKKNTKGNGKFFFPQKTKKPGTSTNE
jgi:hypothetical protein